jgi:serine protease
MPVRISGPFGATVLAVLLALASVVASADPVRVLVKLRPAANVQAPMELDALAARTGVELIESRAIVEGIHLLRGRSTESALRTLRRLRHDPRVLYAELDQRRYAQATPDDPLFTSQWYLQDSEAAAVDAVDAWTMTTGSDGVVIAELDSGVLFNHPDLRSATGNRLLSGYDMISNVQVGNSGKGRNPDASDPGDWVTEQDTKTALFSDCTVSNSTWHGTRVAGILGALTNNSSGIAGLNWSGWILPVRVLGKCGGYDSDILSGMAWAAGLPVSGLPNNPYPARIINMSLGATGSCPQSYQDTIDRLSAIGVLVVVSAGNEGGPVDAPANCNGVAAVAGLRQVGTKVGYSSLGPQIALSAPAGNCVNTGANEPCLFSIETTSNSGTTVPATNTYTDEYHFNVGTSFSAPIVAGIAGLMLAVNGNLSASQLIERLQLGSSAPFPAPVGLPTCHVPANAKDLQTSECVCTTAVCGAGMANAHGAVLQAQRPIAAVALPMQVKPGGSVALNGSGSAAACGAKVAGYHWSIIEPTNAAPLQNPDSAQVSVTAPSGASIEQLMLTVTDDAGRTDEALVVLSSTAASSAAPASAGTQACVAAVSYTPTSAGDSGAGPSGNSPSHGGGGALDLLSLFGCAALAVRGSRRYARRSAASSHSRCARR